MSQIRLNGGSEIEPRLTPGRLEAERAADGDAPSRGAIPVPPRIADSISLSERAAAIGELAARVRQLPDIRHDRIEQFRALVQTGVYHPPAADIADAMIRDDKTTAKTI
ncbi:MAG: flagellar biosynthesis anti-sigma factor FlgM [Blastocatellia bacterium]